MCMCEIRQKTRLGSFYVITTIVISVYACVECDTQAFLVVTLIKYGLSHCFFLLTDMMYFALQVLSFDVDLEKPS